MKILHKLISFMLVLVLAVTMLTACDDNSRDDNIKESVKVYAEPVTVRFAFSNILNQPGIDKNIVAEIENRTRDSLNLKLEFTDFGVEYFESLDKYYEKITSLIEEGTDVIGVDSNLEDLAGRGLLLDITDLLPQYAPTLYKTFTSEQLAAGTYNGRLYMIPGRKYGSVRTAVLVRNELIEMYGLQPIKTFDDYEKFMELIKEKAPYYYPTANIYINPYAFIRASGYFKVDGDMFYKWSDPYMTLIPAEQTEIYHEAMTRLIDWRNKGYFTDAPSKPEEAFRSEKVASIMLPLALAVDYIKAYRVSDKFVIYPINPDIYAEGGDGSSGGIAITKAAEEPERILKLLEWIYSSQENYDLLMYGVKGKDYTLHGERVVIPAGKTYRSWCGSDYFFYSEYMRLMEGDPAELKDYYSGKLDPRAIVPPHKGFKPDLSKVQELADQRKKLLSNQYDIIRGTIDMTIDDYENALKEAGANVLRDEIQRQLNEWLEERDQ